ncbi:hypothetical protein ACLBX9_28775 [Methylobacterium sp. A49B]
MSYITTPPAIEIAVREGRLCELILEFDSDPVRRGLFVYPQLRDDLARAREIPRMGALKGDLEGFVIGQFQTLAMTPRKHKNAMMGRLSPPSAGIWDIRSRRDPPGIRVFGGFAARDVFVALNWHPRSRRIEGFDKEPLGDPQKSYAFELAALNAEDLWQEALPHLPRVVGENPDDYLSENFSAE